MDLTISETQRILREDLQRFDRTVDDLKNKASRLPTDENIYDGNGESS